MASGRYMAYSPSPSTAPQSPHISGIRSASTALVEQEKYVLLGFTAGSRNLILGRAVCAIEVVESLSSLA